MNSQKYELASAEWRAYMHGLISERLSRLGEQSKEVDWSFCEVFTDAPKHLQTDGSSAAWYCTVQSGRVSFGSTELADATLKVVADYNAILPLARYDTRGKESRQIELAKLSKRLMDEGAMRVLGDPSRLDTRLGSFHDAIAAVTT